PERTKLDNGMGTRTRAYWTEGARAEAARALSWSGIVAGLLTLMVGVLSRRWPIPGYRSVPLILTGLLAIPLGLVFRIGRVATWPSILVYYFAAPILVALVQMAFAGAPSFAPMIELWPIVFGFAFLPRRLAIAITVESLVALAAIFTFQDGWDPAFAFWAFLTGTIGMTVWLTITLVERAERHADELDALNRTLEERVETQVGEMQRLARLRRFLSPAIADAVVEAEGDDWLAPHRSEIAVLFCDLRGFTAFAAVAEPEDVSELIQTYHRIIGELVEEHNATVGGFVGDGVWLYFNDPVPVPDPAACAVRLALDLAPGMDELSTRWLARGHTIGYGVGIALGHATLGITGFDARRDYTALGTVVNLASRLSDEARASQVLLDPRARSAIEGVFATEAIGEMRLKGFPNAVGAYAVRAPD
ncbi:MAG: adenylate/guanylate cyclase domain-containing protein, partial [Actinomycetota bacterium]